MKANGKSVIITLGIAAAVVAAALALQENYGYLIFIGLFLMFLIIVYLGLSIRS